MGERFIVATKNSSPSGHRTQPGVLPNSDNENGWIYHTSSLSESLYYGKTARERERNLKTWLNKLTHTHTNSVFLPRLKFKNQKLF